MEACADRTQSCVLAVIIGVEGPSYRPLGAMMTVLQNGCLVGTLSSGCVEADIRIHALKCLKSGVSKVVRYGRGSPYLDIVLPCGGGLQIILIPNPDKEITNHLLNTVITDRRACAYDIDCETGAIFLSRGGKIPSAIFRGKILPELKFLIFGKGPELTTFATLAQSANFQTTLYSPDSDTLEEARSIGCEAMALTRPEFPTDANADPRTAIVLFFHDHDWEPPILRDALLTSAFYIGAQGSKRTRDNRLDSLRAMGAAEHSIARLLGPIGLIDSARDARTLAISVLAEVISEANGVNSKNARAPRQFKHLA
ncbi:xanthine dehydrogenase accessory factor [Octadecabacter temperatus]|uniref:XdhC and CoxI family protein n=1 Tax=Octadecabacter temperatus TaxID=1458307 RepID=A0A0K0Y2N2_9RHOB|nr:XdhC and CoxI family protein [Octadecabacter temperatus]SIN87395.1 xanthine dehydrogenase accessory factor [Octadecabacter temperatus]